MPLLAPVPLRVRAGAVLTGGSGAVAKCLGFLLEWGNFGSGEQQRACMSHSLSFSGFPPAQAHPGGGGGPETTSGAVPGRSRRATGGTPKHKPREGRSDRREREARRPRNEQERKRQDRGRSRRQRKAADAAGAGTARTGRRARRDRRPTRPLPNEAFRQRRQSKEREI